MNAEYFGGYDGCDGEAVEDVDEGSPDFNVTSSFAFVIESVHSGHICTFVIPAQEEKVLRVLEFITKK